jgi:hypothetical protein
MVSHWDHLLCLLTDWSRIGMPDIKRWEFLKARSTTFHSYHCSRFMHKVKFLPYRVLSSEFSILSYKDMTKVYKSLEFKNNLPNTKLLTFFFLMNSQGLNKLKDNNADTGMYLLV